MKKSILNYLTDICEAHDSCGRHNLVAAVVYKKIPISIGFNSYTKTHPQQLLNSDYPYLHAEVDAINKARKRIGIDKLKDCDIYVVRVKRNRKHGLAKPCENCQQLIDNVGIRKVYHTYG